MKPCYGFLVEFLVITTGIAVASYFPLYGVPFCLLSMAVLRFLISARQDEPRSVRLFIALVCAGMVSLALGVPQRWLIASQFRVDISGIVYMKGFLSPIIWRSALLIIWCALFYNLLRRYRFTEATAKNSAEQSEVI